MDAAKGCVDFENKWKPVEENGQSASGCLTPIVVFW